LIRIKAIHFFSQANERDKIVALMPIILGATITDMALGSYSDLVAQMAPNFRILLFFVIVGLLYGVGQYFILRFVTRMIGPLGSHLFFKKLPGIMRIIQWVILCILVVVIFQIIGNSSYSMALLASSVAVGAVPGSILLGISGYQLFSWYRSDRKNIMILFLGLGSVVGSVSIAGNIIIVQVLLSEKPPMVSEHTEMEMRKFSSIPSVQMLFTIIYALLSVVAYAVQWIGIALLLWQFSRKIGRVRYWVVVLLPAATFVGTILPSLLSPEISQYGFYSDHVLTIRTIVIISALAGAFVVGAAYLLIARTLSSLGKDKSQVAGYMTLAAFGIIIMHIAYLSPVYFPAYPPFGVAGHSFLAVGTFLYAIGYYSSAISVSKDIQLRKSIRKYALQECRLVGSIGSAQMEQELQKKIITAVKRNSETEDREIGIEPSLLDDEIMNYLAKVMDELKKNSK
jgi:hypothetical protein